MYTTDLIPGNVKPRANGNKNSGTVYTNKHGDTFIFKYKGKHKELVHIDEYDKHGDLVNSVDVPKEEFDKPLRKMDQWDFKTIVNFIPLWVMRYKEGKKI